MKKSLKLIHSKAIKNQQEIAKREQLNKHLLFASQASSEALLTKLNATRTGLNEEDVAQMRATWGSNIVTQGKEHSLLKRLTEAFINPFTAILFVLAIISFFTDIVLAEPKDENPVTVIIIVTMVMISGLLRFVQETRSGNAAARLSEMVRTTTCVERFIIPEGSEKGQSCKIEINLDEVVVGDIVHLAAGDLIPADLRILSAKDLFINQSSLTGESEPLEKVALTIAEEKFDNIGLVNPTELTNLIFMGSTVVSGFAVAVVIATGDQTMLGSMVQVLTEPQEATSFEKGVNSVSWILIRFMLVMVPIVFFINGLTKGDWTGALLFAISIGVGLTPEMLPMIVTTCLAKGAVSMSRKKTIIKNINSIQNFGSMDILCTDKTGTLTQDKVVLEYHLNIAGDEDPRILRHGFLNSFFQTGLKNLMDIAIVDHLKHIDDESETLKYLATYYTKVDEIPFDFVRRRMSVVVADPHGKTQMITKGAVEEMLAVCSHVEYKDCVQNLTDEIKKDILKTVDKLNNDGMRVIAIAQKNNPSPVGAFGVKDETAMVLMGYLAFLDPPKASAAKAIEALRQYGVETKILTGDNEKVTACICRLVGLSTKRILLGADIDAMNDKKLSLAVESTNIFAKLSPQQKSRIVSMLKENGHIVGFMGDGINDAAAMKTADVGISVDTAVDIAKESANIILLEKDLMVLEEGIIEGRKTYANMIKYIKMTASSNFGNMFSVLIASAFLPFLPMASVHLIVLNLIYDISCTAIPWDNVDQEYLKKPRKWDASSVGSFMVWIGPTSSVFDITTYLLMYFVICPAACGGLLYTQITDPATQLLYVALFQAGWFVESMWSQTLVMHMIRTPKIPFIQSRASFPVFVLTFTGIFALTTIPFTKLGTMLGLAPLPLNYFGWLILTIILYMGLATLMKRLYVKRYNELL